MGAVPYSTREAVKLALDSKLTARDNARVDDALLTASDTIEGFLHRRFYPELATRYFDWPPYRGGRAWRLWLEENEVISVTTLASGGETIASADYILRNFTGDSEPPYTAIELDRSSNAAFGGGDTPQQDIALTALYGHSNSEAPAGALAEALDASETAVDVTNSTIIGVGQLIRVENERMLVTEKSMLTTGQTVQTPLTASKANVSVVVTTGSAFFVGETILLDSERMLIDDIAGNTLTVQRAWDGTVLATHTGSTIYAPRTLTVERGALGTTAATHADATAIVKHRAPTLVRQLAVAEALVELAQMSNAYARIVGSGENAREASGRGLAQLRKQAWARYGRQARTAAI